MLIELVTPAGLTREKFVAELHSRGLLDVNIPRSTGLLHQEPLYKYPYDLLPHLYHKQGFSIDSSKPQSDKAQDFYDEAIKMPVYATANG